MAVFDWYLTFKPRPPAQWQNVLLKILPVEHELLTVNPHYLTNISEAPETHNSWNFYENLICVNCKCE